MGELLAIALAPGLAIILFIYFKDEHEKEPIKLLALSFLFGIASTLVTLVISYRILPLLPQIPATTDIIWSEMYNAFISVGFVEEFSKYIFLIFFIYPNKEFNEPFDGIVYAVMIGMGFATFENILYTYNGGLEVGISRMFTAVPAHGAFAVIMGYFAGSAKFRKRNKAYSLLGLLFATILHGAYDYFLFISHIPGIFMYSLVTLILGIGLSFRAIRIHSDASPFRFKLNLRKRRKEIEDNE